MSHSIIFISLQHLYLQVPKDYAAFEKLQKDLVDTFPELSLPDLPRKFHLFMTASDVEDRQVAFDCLVKVVAKNREMCTSVPLLRFLGVDLLADRNYYKDRREFLKHKEEEAANVKEKEDRIFGDRSEEIEQGLFETGSGEDVDLFKTDSKGRKPLAGKLVLITRARDESVSVGIYKSNRLACTREVRWYAP